MSSCTHETFIVETTKVKRKFLIQPVNRRTTYQVKAPHEIDGRRDENQTLDQVLEFFDLLDADPSPHAAANQHHPGVGVFFGGHLDGSSAVVEPVAELQGQLVARGLSEP